MLIAPVVVLPPLILAVAEVIEPVVLLTSNFAFDPADVTLIHTLPPEVIRIFSSSVPLEEVLKDIPALLLPTPPPVITALPPFTPIAAYSLDSSAPVIPSILEVSLPLKILNLDPIAPADPPIFV